MQVSVRDNRVSITLLRTVVNQLSLANGSVYRGWAVDWTPINIKMVQKWRCSQHASTDQTPGPCIPAASRWLDGEKIELSGVLKSGKHRFDCKANKCSDTGIENLGVLTAHETTSRDISICNAVSINTALLEEY